MSDKEYIEIAKLDEWASMRITQYHEGKEQHGTRYQLSPISLLMELAKANAVKLPEVSDKWISVKDRLPEPRQAVLGYREIMQTYSVIFLNSEGEFMYMYEPEYPSDITHWQEITPPQEGE